MLTIGKEHSVAFDVSVMGTSAEPTVRLVLASTPELIFGATRAGDQWISKCLVPDGVKPGEYDLRVEVVINNRLFTPTTKRVQVLLPEPINPVKFEPQVTQVTQDDKFAEPAQSLLRSIVVEPPQKIGEDEVDIAAEQLISDIAYKPTVIQSPSLSTIIKTYESGTMSALRRVAERKVLPRITTPLPKPTDVKPADVSVSIATVAAIAEKLDKPKRQSKPKAAQVVEVKATLPIRLIKGDITYE